MFLNKIMALMSVLVLGVSCTDATAAQRDNDRPSTHGFPQIIQESDYPTIIAVEALAMELEKVPKTSLSCFLENESIHFKTQGKGEVIHISDTGAVLIGGRPYNSKNTIVLFNTLKVLRDLRKGNPCVLQYDQFGTGAYKRRTIMEFAFGPR